MEEVVTLKLETYDKLIKDSIALKAENEELDQELYVIRDKVNYFAYNYIKDNAKPALKEASVNDLLNAQDLNEFIYLGDLHFLTMLLDNDDIWNLLDDIVKEQTNEADQ